MRNAWTLKTLLLASTGIISFATPIYAQRTDEGPNTKGETNSEKGQVGDNQQLKHEQLIEKYGVKEEGKAITPNVVTPPAVVKTTPPVVKEEKDERPAFLGVHYEVSRTDVMGSYVTDVEPSTPAYDVGLRRGDVIIKADGQPLDQLEDLVRIISTKHVGDKVALTVNRAGRIFTVSPALAERTRDLVTYQYGSADGMYTLPNGGTLWIEDGVNSARPFLGVTFRREEKILRIDGEEVIKSEASKDLVVAEVVEGSTAKLMGIQPGDVITAMNGRPVHDFDVLTSMLQNMEVGEEIRLTYLRAGRPFNTIGRLRAHPGTGDMGMKMNPKPSIGGGPSAGESYSMDRMVARMKEMAAEAHASNARVVSIIEDPVAPTEAAAIRRNSGMDFANSSTLPLEGFRIQPNGTAGAYVVEFNLTTRGNTLIYVLDEAGNIAYSESLPAFSGQYRKPFNLPNDALGAYYVQITQAGRSFTRKVTLL